MDLRPDGEPITEWVVGDNGGMTFLHRSVCWTSLILLNRFLPASCLDVLCSWTKIALYFLQHSDSIDVLV
jgi:hypothetical protein